MAFRTIHQHTTPSLTKRIHTLAVPSAKLAANRPPYKRKREEKGTAAIQCISIPYKENGIHKHLGGKRLKVSRQCLKFLPHKKKHIKNAIQPILKRSSLNPLCACGCCTRSFSGLHCGGREWGENEMTTLSASVILFAVISPPASPPQIKTKIKIKINHCSVAETAASMTCRVKISQQQCQYCLTTADRINIPLQL